MEWVSLIIAIATFLFKELPGFLRQLKLANKDSRYKTSKERREAAYKAYRKSLSLEDLNELSK